MHQATVAHGWGCQDWKPGLLDSFLHPAIFLHTRLAQIAARTSLWSLQLKNPTGLNSLFLFFPRTWRGHLTPAREAQSNTPLKSLLWQQLRPITTKNKQIIKKAKISLVWCLQPVWGFYSTLVIYHDHLSMPVNIIIHHQKKKKVQLQDYLGKINVPLVLIPAQFICYFATRANCFLLI